MKDKKKILLLILIFVLLLVFCYNKYQVIENLDTAYPQNNLLGGAIITLQKDLSKINEDLETVIKNFDGIYPAKSLAKTANTATSRVYHEIHNIIPIINSIIEADIIKGKDASASSNKITNTNIKGGSADIAWVTFINLLRRLKSDFNGLLDKKDAYLANIPTPLPEKISSQQKEMISIFKTINIPINAINIYISNIIAS
jgi:hypothetical protein